MQRTAAGLMTVFLILAAGNTIAQGSAPADTTPAPPPKPAIRVRELVGMNFVTVRYDAAAHSDGSVWGTRVPFGEVWNGSGGLPATLEAKESVTINGESLAAGVYDMRIVPRASQWEFQFWSPTDTDGPALRIAIETAETAYEPNLVYRFEPIDDTRAALILHWGERSGRLEIALENPLPQFEGDAIDVFTVCRTGFRHLFMQDLDAMMERFTDDMVSDQGGKEEYRGFLTATNESGAFDDLYIDVSKVTVEVIGDAAMVEGLALHGIFGVVNIQQGYRKSGGVWKVNSVALY